MEEKGEGEAEISSKEEEFLAICQLHGVVPSAPVGLQLKAVEAEYHSLREAGQTHKADQVQQLHAWKSKKVLEVGRCKVGLYLHISLIGAACFVPLIFHHTHTPHTHIHAHRPVRAPTLWIQGARCTMPNSSSKMLSALTPPIPLPATILAGYASCWERERLPCSTSLLPWP